MEYFFNFIDIPTLWLIKQMKAKCLFILFYIGLSLLNSGLRAQEVRMLPENTRGSLSGLLIINSKFIS